MASADKRCSKCRTHQPLANFHNDKHSPGGLTRWCKQCHKNARDAKKDSHREYMRVYNQANKDRALQYRRDNAQRMAEYNKGRRAETNAWYKEKRKTDPNFRLSNDMRTVLRRALKCGKITKSSSAGKLLGFDIDTFRRWLEFHFEPWMSWDNYGKWHIDHVLPISRFDLSNPEEQRVCLHWSNMQPMCAKANIAKKNTIVLHDYFNCLISAHRFIASLGCEGNREYQALRESLAWLRAKT